MVHRVLKSDLKMSKASARWVSRLLYRKMTADKTQLVTRFSKLSNVFNNLNDVRRWVRCIAGKISAQTSLFDIFLSKFAC